MTVAKKTRVTRETRINLFRFLKYLLTLLTSSNMGISGKEHSLGLTLPPRLQSFHRYKYTLYIYFYEVF